MNDYLYQLGIYVFDAAVSIRVLAKPISLGCMVWLRFARLHEHLAALNFDGVIDGGANVGEFARLVRRALPDADLVCVEPQPKCAQKLRGAGFQVVEAALWSEAKNMILLQPTKATTSATLVPKQGESGPSWKVRAVRLADVEVRGKRLLIKLDLQGAELNALNGMDDDLWSRCAGILLEVRLGAGENFIPLREIIEARGFREYSTVNELEIDGRVVEADKLWVRSGDALPHAPAKVRTDVRIHPCAARSNKRSG